MIRAIASARPIQAFAALCTLVLITCPSAFAQSDNEPDIEDRWALQFGVTENFNLGSFEGSLLSAKKQYNARRAVRVGVGLSADIQTSTDESDGSTREEDQSYQRAEVDVKWIRYPVHDGTLRAYWGTGPSVEFVRNSTTFDDANRTELDRLSLGAGLTGVLGAEWFVHPRISLSAEYRAGLTYRWTREDDTLSAGDDSETIRHNVRLGSRGVLFGVSAYF